MIFIIESILLGISLAMDAFSVSVANGISKSFVERKKMFVMAFTFAFFQFFMPFTGYLIVNILSMGIKKFITIVPYIAFILLMFLGGKMIIESILHKTDIKVKDELTVKELLIQGVATSIDALSVGFVIVKYSMFQAFMASLIIGVVTFFICISGCVIGKKIGDKMGEKLNSIAEIVGGCILVAIGLWVLLG
ncbi:MAG: manganese efflux pump MntP family protein [Lachnospiraceae bacterium]|nr:manganese efflux pump MntP family protein [Lachnospiraceae bacterium]